MKGDKSFSKLEVVNKAISTFTDAGFVLDQHDVAFVWEIANNTVSPEDVEAWRKRLRSKSSRIMFDVEGLPPACGVGARPEFFT